MTKENIQQHGILFIKTLQRTSCLNANVITTVLTGPNIDHRLLLLHVRSGSDTDENTQYHLQMFFKKKTLSLPTILLTKYPASFQSKQNSQTTHDFAFHTLPTSATCVCLVTFRTSVIVQHDTTTVKTPIVLSSYGQPVPRSKSDQLALWC